jgi:hypothetical protein
MWNNIYKSRYYAKYKNLIFFNKNIIISSIITGIINIIIVQYISILFHGDPIILSFVSVAVDFAIYNVFFLILYFLVDNRKRYFNAEDSKNKSKARTTALRLVTTLGISEISYLSTKFLSSYLLFDTMNIEASTVSLITTIIAWVVYIITVNLLVRKQNLT